MPRLQELWHSRRGRIGLALVVVLCIVSFFLYRGWRGETSEALYAEVQVGAFDVRVVVQGELEAQNSVDIAGPADLMRSRNFKISEVQIKDLVPEGTLVDSGDYVASLDKGALSNLLKTLADDVEKAEQQLIKVQLDTTLTLRELRNSLQNTEYELTEKQLVLEQSKYEPPAIIRQAELSLEKCERSLRQAQENYKLKTLQFRSTVREAQLNLEKVLRQQAELNTMLDRFTIYAPKRGMVIYAKEWGGKKRKVGSAISPWEPNVATLPDLSDMVSKTYVNEIDISRVRVGLKVEVGVDAFPERRYRGTVTEVANVGEQVAGSDAKVFEVLIHVDEQDSILRPAMTTSNAIIVYHRDSARYAPLECVYANDSLSFVYLASGVRQQVKTGASNDWAVEIVDGVAVGTRLYLSTPPDGDAFPWSFLKKE